LDIARGTYVYFAAADDWVTSDFFARTLQLLREHPRAGLACSDAILVDGYTLQVKGNRPTIRPCFQTGFVSPAAVRRLLKSTDNWIWTGSAIFRRSAILTAGGLDPALKSFADGYLVRKIALTSGFCYAPTVNLYCSLFSESVSQSLVFDPRQSGQLLEIAINKMSRDPAFPAWYPLLFRRRWIFGIARHTLENYPQHKALLLEIAPRSQFQRTLLDLSFTLPNRRIARVATLALLWWLWRPFSLIQLAMTALLRTSSVGLNGPGSCGRFCDHP